MPPPYPYTAFISLHPLEPVLVFSTPTEALAFQQRFHQARILGHQNPAWVFLPMPDGLSRVRTAKNGDVAFDFRSTEEGRRFNASIGDIGRVWANSGKVPHADRTVYLGKEKH